jgi:tripartite-type tricarboxylate transporter receptor subunit TctC
MEENIMNGKALWNAKERKTVPERKPADRSQAPQWVLMTAGAIVGVALLIVAMVAPLCAQSYPNKPLRLIVPFSTGGTGDTTGRIVAQKLSERLGQPVLVENRGGAGGNVGHELGAQAKPDGYTILAPSSSLASAASLYKNLKFNPSKDFIPASPSGQIPLVVVVRSSLPVKSLKEFVDYAKANSGKLNYASSGHGTTAQLASELFLDIAKIKVQHVAYKSAGDVMIALLSGETDMGVVGPPSVLPHIQSGKVRVLAVLRDGKERLQSLRDVPTTAELGINGCEVSVWFGIFVPAGTPRDIVNRLNAEWTHSAKTPQTIDMMNKVGLEPLTSTPEEYAAFFKAEIVRWAKVIKDANLSLK